MNQGFYTQKYTDFREKEIVDYLEKVKNTVKEDKFSIAETEKNNMFISEYNLNESKIKKIILQLTYKDFCYAVDNYDPRYSHEVLYIFCINIKLDNWGEIRDTKVYIKFNKLIEKSFCYIVSIHEPEKPITKVFS